MTNKEMMEMLFHQKLNKQKNYSRILQRLEGEAKTHVNYGKRATAIICVLLLGILFSYYKTHHTDVQDKELIIYMNEVMQPVNNTKTDVLQQEIVMNDEGCYIENADRNALDAEASSNIGCFPFKKLKIPDDLAAFEADYALYSKSETTDNILLEYQKAFKNNDFDRRIIIHYTKGNQLYQGYDFKDGKASIINQQRVYIYHFDNSYWVRLTHKQMYVIVEARNINETELIALLRSIVE